MGSRDLRRVYAIDPETWTVLEEREAPGIPWAAVATNGTLRFTVGEGPEDDRYLRTYDPASGFGEDRIECPEFTGSYLSFDGAHLYLSQWYKHRILMLDVRGNVLRIIEVGAEKPNEDWRIARLDPRQETPNVQDLARVPFACRSLTFDGAYFWTNYRVANEIVSFSLPNEQKS